MLKESEIKYFMVRYAHANDMAQAATNPAVRSIHLELASLYAARLEGRVEAASERSAEAA